MSEDQTEDIKTIRVLTFSSEQQDRHKWSQKFLSMAGETGYREIMEDNDIIPSTAPGAGPPRDVRDSGSARSHSTHLETSSSDRPYMVTYMGPQTVPSYMSVK